MFLAILKEAILSSSTNLEHPVSIGRHIVIREGSRCQIRFLEKCQRVGWRGGGAFLVQKFILQILGTLNRAFEHEIDKKKSNFRVQSMFFQQSY